jgi:hypothetical protein
MLKRWRVYAPEAVRLAAVMRNTEAPHSREHDTHARHCPRIRAFNAFTAGPSSVAVSRRQLGGVLPSVPTLDGMAASDVKTVHQRPSVAEELEWCPVISMANGPSLKPAVKNMRSSQIEDKVKLPWRLRRSGAGVGLTVSGVDISIQRHGFKLSKSVTF